MGVGEPLLPHHAQLADLLVPVGLLLLARRLRAAAWWPWAALYLGWAAISAAVHSAGGWKLLGIGELVAVLALAATLDEEERQKVVRGWVVGAAALAAVALVVSSLSGAGVATPWQAGG